MKRLKEATDNLYTAFCNYTIQGNLIERSCDCCGSSSTSELNQVCPNCDAEIGLLVADCWMLHFIGIDLTKVRIQ